MAFTLPELGFSYDALEPSIDARTMEIHYSKHHQAYITNLNNALAGKPDLESKTADALIRDLASVPEDIRGAVILHFSVWMCGNMHTISTIRIAVPNTFPHFGMWSTGMWWLQTSRLKFI